MAVPEPGNIKSRILHERRYRPNEAQKRAVTLVPGAYTTYEIPLSHSAITGKSE
jgi:hypothetical protein